MLQHALRASDLERRRMTRTLHDGVIQDLAGLAYVLPTVTPTEPRNADEAELRSTLLEATDLIKSDVRQLRDILADLYPPSLEKEGLDAALTELADWAGPQRDRRHRVHPRDRGPRAGVRTPRLPGGARGADQRGQPLRRGARARVGAGDTAVRGRDRGARRRPAGQAAGCGPGDGALRPPDPEGRDDRPGRRAHRQARLGRRHRAACVAAGDGPRGARARATTTS